MSPFEECGSGSNTDAGFGAGCVPTERHSESDAGRHQTEPEEQATHVPIVKTSPKRSQKGLTFYQTRSNAINLHETLPAFCIPKVVMMETGEVIYEKVYMSPRPPPKISLKHDWKRELGSEHAQRPEGQVVRQSRSFQSNQPTPNPSSDRTGQPFVRTDRSGQPVVGTNTRTVHDGRKTSHSQEIDVSSFHEEAVSSDRTGQPVVETCRTQTRSSDDSKSINVEMAHDRTEQPVVETNTENVPDCCQTRSCHESIRFNVGDETFRDRTGQPVVNHDTLSHEQTMVNEANMDFRIPGLPHSVVKQAENSNVRELIQKIENHPDRHALQQDLRQNKAHNPFSPESKRMIQDVGNVELFELFETDTKTQCKACLTYWSEGIVYCTCGHLLKETVANRGFIVYTLDLLSIPEYVIKKGRPHGHRYGKLPENKEYHLAHNLKKRCKKRDYKGIHDRFLRDHVFRERMIETVEMKKFVAHGTFLQNQITPIICQKKNTSTTRTNGGSISINRETTPNQ